MDPQWNLFQPSITEQAVLDYNRSYNNSRSSYSSSSSSNQGGYNYSDYSSGGQYPPLNSKANSYSNRSMISSPDYTNYSNIFPPSSYSSVNYSSSPLTNSHSSSQGQPPPQSNYYSNSNSQYSPPIPDFKIGTFTLDSTSSHDSMSTNSSSRSNSSYQQSNGSPSSNQSSRETGIIEKLLQTYGFIQCCERQARLFFHFSQFDGNTEHLRIGDPVEFEVTFDRRTGKPIASTVTKISPEVVKVLSEERVIGTVTTELRSEHSGEQQGRITYENRGECFFLPYCKEDVEGYVTLKPEDKVSFQIATNQRSGSLGARHVRLENPVEPVKYRGVVSSIKESYGFIERADVVDEIFFHFSEAKNIPDGLKLGDDVEFLIQSRNGKEVAANMMKLNPGTVVFEDINAEDMKGQVLKPVEEALKTNQKDPLTGRIRYRGKDRSEVEVKFGERDQKGDFTLRHGDWVQFNIATDRRDHLQKATNISLLDESFWVSGEKREQGIVCILKEGFGFVKCADRDSRMHFSYEELLDPQTEISVGDEVQFTVISDQTGQAQSRQSAIRIRKLEPGTVKFEVLIQEGMEGEVCMEPSLLPKSPSKVGQEEKMQHGIISYVIDNIKQTVNYYAKENDRGPQVGDRVIFNMYLIKRTKERIAIDIKVISPIITSITPNSCTSGRQSMVGSGRTFDRGSTSLSTLPMSNFPSTNATNMSSNVISTTQGTTITTPQRGMYTMSGNIDVTMANTNSGPQGSSSTTIPSSEQFTNQSITSPMAEFTQISSNHSNGNVCNSSQSTPVLSTNTCATATNVNTFTNSLTATNNADKISSTNVNSTTLNNFNNSMSKTKSNNSGNAVDKVNNVSTSNTNGNSNKMVNGGNNTNVGIKTFSRPPIPIHQGYVAALKDSFGFIETLNHDKEIFFHFSNVEGEANNLELGQEVEYTISPRTGPGGKLSAENVNVLPVGSLATPKILGELFDGTVLRSMRSVNPDQQEYCGLICVGKEEDKLGRHQFGITGLVNKKELLQPCDQITFQLDEDGWAVNICAVRKKLIAVVEAVKGQYGFLNYETDEGKKLFFHQSEVRDGIVLTPGDEVQFVVITNLKTGKSSACNIVRMLSSTGSSQRPDRLVSKLKSLHMDNSKSRVRVIRQPKGPDGTKGFKLERTI